MKKISFLLSVIIFFCCFLISVAHSATAPGNQELLIHFIDVGQGDAAFISLPNDENVLIDTGSPAAGPRIIQYLRSLNVRKINHMILSHPHDDHIGGIFNVVSEFEVEHFYDNGFSNFQSTLYGDYIKLIRQDISRYTILQSGEALKLEKLRIDVLNPLLPPTGNLNNDSIVLKLRFGDITILFAGDIGNLGEQRLMNTNEDLASHIVKIGHHGDNSASSEKFMKRVNPDIAIISVGEMNKYGKPHQGLLDRLKEMGITIYRTDKNGTVVVKTDGKKYHISTGKREGKNTIRN